MWFILASFLWKMCEKHWFKMKKMDLIQSLLKNIYDLECSEGTMGIEHSPVEEERLYVQEQYSINSTGRGYIP